MHHVLSALDLDSEDIAEILDRARYYRRNYRSCRKSLHGRYYASLFFEPSTRTRFALETAAKRLGMDGVSTDDAARTSSASKGESLEDTMRVVSGLVDALFIRCAGDQDLAEAAAASSVPVINAGDGTHEHPLQAYTDLFTIAEERRSGRLPERPLTLFCFGDNARSRTVRSLMRLIARGDAKEAGVEIASVTFGGVKELAKPDEALITELFDAGIEVFECGPEIQHRHDLFYFTRTQHERGKRKMPTPKPLSMHKGQYMPEHAMILHPLPRNEEIGRGVDADQRAFYFEQAQNKLYVAMALLEIIVDQ